MTSEARGHYIEVKGSFDPESLKDINYRFCEIMDTLLKIKAKIARCDKVRHRRSPILEIGNLVYNLCMKKSVESKSNFEFLINVLEGFTCGHYHVL